MRIEELLTDRAIRFEEASEALTQSQLASALSVLTDGPDEAQDMASLIVDAVEQAYLYRREMESLRQRLQVLSALAAA